jgi:ribonuclease P protein component
MNTGFRKPVAADHRWTKARWTKARDGGDNLLAACLQRAVSLGTKDHVYQTHLSAFRRQAQAHARIPGSHEITRRPRSSQRAAREGTQTPGGLSEGRPTVAYGFSRAHRLQSEAQFAAVAQAGPESIRLSQRWFVLIAKPVVPTETTDAPPVARVRFGLTVGKRLARRSVDRLLIKRILREAARHSRPRLVELARSDLDVVLRLKAPLPAREATPRAQLKRALRDDADAVLRRLVDRLIAGRSQ